MHTTPETFSSSASTHSTPGSRRSRLHQRHPPDASGTAKSPRPGGFPLAAFRRRPVRMAPRIQAPVLIQIGDHEELVSSTDIVKAAIPDPQAARARRPPARSRRPEAFA